MYFLDASLPPPSQNSLRTIKKSFTFHERGISICPTGDTMKAFLLAAGYGERLRPLTDTMPKPLVPVGGVPCICYSLACLKAAGISDLVCNVHYRAEDVMGFFRDNRNFGFNISFSVEEEILGTGGGLEKCRDHFTEDFIMINSDIVSDLDLGAMVRTHEAAGSGGVIAVYDSGRGNATVSVKNGTVRDFKNDLGTGITPRYDYMGAAVLGPSIFPCLSKKFSSVVYTGFTGLVQSRGLSYYEHKGMWKDIGSIEEYHNTDRELKASSGLARQVEDVLGME